MNFFLKILKLNKKRKKIKEKTKNKKQNKSRLSRICYLCTCPDLKFKRWKPRIQKSVVRTPPPPTVYKQFHTHFYIVFFHALFLLPKPQFSWQLNKTISALHQLKHKPFQPQPKIATIPFQLPRSEWSYEFALSSLMRFLLQIETPSHVSLSKNRTPLLLMKSLFFSKIRKPGNLVCGFIRLKDFNTGVLDE